MKALLGLMMLGGALVASNQALAVDAKAAKSIAAKNACLACHAIDKKVIGPAYKDVSAKYKGVAGAEDKLVAKVKAGGSGVWGTMAMPPHPQVSDDDLHTVVQWVLSL